jgi:hypothetical protein
MQIENNESAENNKKILITGTNNRYLIKRANRVKNEVKKREIINKYNINTVFLQYENQIQLLKEMYSKINEEENCFEKNVLKQEIERKVNSYKHQDLLKKKFNESLFIDVDSVIQKLVETDMQCFYCNCKNLVLYEFVREMTQWTVDRINNNEGHNKDNFVIACLNCNIKRRNTNSNKFLFTKQLNLIKIDE